MDPIVRYERAEPVADGASAVVTITIDDGKANVLSMRMLDELRTALDRAEEAGAVVVLTGRATVFSGGFDLAVLRSMTPAAADLARGGFELARRLLDFPWPVIAAVNGHAVAMGAFVVLCADHRVGISGAGHRLVANEVAMGITLPYGAIEICRQRLTPAAVAQFAHLSETFSGEAAVVAGLLDAVVPAENFATSVGERATRFAALNLRAFRNTKRRANAEMLGRLDPLIERDDTDFRRLIASPRG